MIKPELPSVSIIIPTLNSERVIEGCLESIGNLTYPKEKLEVIVADGHSKDRTVKIAKDHGAKVVYENVGTRGGACNFGVTESNGEILVFTDDDCIVEPDWINKIVERFVKVSIDGLGGIDLTPPNSSPFERVAGLIEEYWRKDEVRSFSALFRIKGCNSAYRKSTLIKVGLFDPYLPYNEETELNLKLVNSGYTILYDPTIYVWHRRRGGIRQYLRYNYRAGRKSLQSLLRSSLLRKYMLRSTVIKSFLGALLAILLLSSITLHLMLFVSLGFMVFFYLLVRGLKIAGIRGVHLAIVALFLNHISYLLGVAVEALGILDARLKNMMRLKR
ncbi:MAG: glycosyltransferase [archaeon]|nr:glycosyltransferase [archaeon]MCP8314429.1 glycosyltransferase [archaeon]MCP8319365.1 glycosyltransferase [archaeon]